MSNEAVVYANFPLVTHQEIRSLLMYKAEDPRVDAILEIADYLGLAFEEVEKKFDAEEEGDRKMYRSFESSSSPDQFYSTYEEYLFHLMRTPIQLGGLSDRTVLSLSMSIHEGKKTMMDYGGGSGRDCLAFARKGFHVTYVDLPGPTMEFAKWRFAVRGLECQFESPKSLSPITYDVMTCFDVFEHLDDPMAAFFEISDHLHPGALFFFFGDFLNLEHPLHLKKNVKYRELYPGILLELGFSLAGNAGVLTVWRKT